jgi:low affinity Fe/Cu permease
MTLFDRCAHFIARLAGQAGAFALAVLAIIVWAAAGPFAGYSDTWQLVINTSTTIVTFLMVFLIQNTQNRYNDALHLKIDELLRALDAADTRLCDLEERSEKELERLHEHYRELAADPEADDGSKQSSTNAGTGPRVRASHRNQPRSAGLKGKRHN